MCKQTKSLIKLRKRLSILLYLHYECVKYDILCTEITDEIEYLLTELLPHGSGIDYTWEYTFYRNGTIKCSNAFHAIDSNGMYCAIVPFSIRIRKVNESQGIVYTRIDYKVYCRNSGASYLYGLRNYICDTVYSSLWPFMV